MRYSECGCSVGYVLLLFNAINTISAFSECYPVNGHEYCFYTNGTVMSWGQAREYCGRTNSTLPIVTDEDIDIVFQQFMLDSNNVIADDANNEQMNVWLDAHASPVYDSEPWHWINNDQYSG